MVVRLLVRGIVHDRGDIVLRAWDNGVSMITVAERRLDVLRALKTVSHAERDVGTQSFLGKVIAQVSTCGFKGAVESMFPVAPVANVFIVITSLLLMHLASMSAQYERPLDHHYLPCQICVRFHALLCAPVLSVQAT
jgi:hypothetical protein